MPATGSVVLKGATHLRKRRAIGMLTCASCAALVAVSACSGTKTPDVVVPADSGPDVSLVTDTPPDTRTDSGSIPAKCPVYRAVNCGGAGECPLGTICAVISSGGTDASPVETSVPDTAVSDSEAGASDSTSDVATDADAESDATADTATKPKPDASPETGPIDVNGVCVAAPESCITRCPSTDCVCVAWSLAKDCTIDSSESCPAAGSAIVPVVRCTK